MKVQYAATWCSSFPFALLLFYYQDLYTLQFIKALPSVTEVTYMEGSGSKYGPFELSRIWRKFLRLELVLLILHLTTFIL